MRSSSSRKPWEGKVPDGFRHLEQGLEGYLDALVVGDDDEVIDVRYGDWVGRFVSRRLYAACLTLHQLSGRPSPWRMRFP